MADMNEITAFARLLDSLTQARDCCRGLALARRDTRWLQLAGMFDQIKDNATKLVHARRNQPFVN
jgi:hypothetical protein